MADLLEDIRTALAGRLTGQQSYFLDVTGPASSRELSVVSFSGIEYMGDAYRIEIVLTHPEDLLRSEYLNRDAAFTIDPRDGSASRKFSGFISKFSKLKTTQDFRSYRIVVEAHIARLKITRRSRVYREMSTPQIMEKILRSHGLLGHQFSFSLRGKYPQHAFRFQYQTDDWTYIHMLMEKAGIYCHIVPGEHGDVVHFGDDVDHYEYKPQLKVLYREMSGLASDTVSVYSLQTHSQVVPQSYLVADYNPDSAWERFRADANVARKDVTTYGQPYIYGTHHLDQEGAQWEAQLRHEAAIAWQVVLEGESNVPDLRPGRVFQLDENVAEAPNGQLVVEVTHTGARDEAYRNTYRAIPAERRFRLKFEEEKWPKIHGTLSGRITSPGKYKYAYLTKAGYYTLRLDVDFDEWNPGGEIVPLRLAKPFAGALQTGFHFPALDGTEAIVEFHEGNPDKPYISQFHHNSQQVDLITNQERWLSRNVIRTQSNNKIRMEDWEGQEGIKISTEHSGKSQLNLGYLVDSKKKARGPGGFELRTGGKGAVRAGQGLFISADDQADVNGPYLEMDAAKGLLQQALQQAEALAEAARTAEAVAADYGRQKTLLEGTLDELRKAGILVSAPAGVAMVSGTDLQVGAAENLIGTSGGHTDFSAIRRFTIAAGEAVSVFAQRLGMKLFAAKGKVEIQAQHDEMRLTADQNMTITSSNGRVIIEARQELLLKCGGSYLRMSSTGIEDGTRGDRTFHSASFSRQGPRSISQQMNSLPLTDFDDPYVLRNKKTNEVMKNHPYEIVRADGTRIKALTDEMGRTNVQKNHDVEGVTVSVLHKEAGGNA